MTWRGVLFLGPLVAVALFGVGADLDSSAVLAESLEDIDGLQWPSQFEREAWVGNPNAGRVVVEDGAQGLWYFAGAGTLAPG